MKFNVKFHLWWIIWGIIFVTIGLTVKFSSPWTKDTIPIGKLILGAVGFILFILGIDINISIED